MNSPVKFSLVLAMSVLNVSVAHARGPSPQPWLMYPAKAMANCQAGTASSMIAARCDDLLAAYARALGACMPMRPGGPVTGALQVSLQQTNPVCANAAAKIAAGKVK